MGKPASSRPPLAVFILLMTMVAALSGGIAMYWLYDTAIEQQRARLRDAVRKQARLIEAVARHEQALAKLNGGDAEARTLAQVRDAYRHTVTWGKTTELVLGRRRGSRIEFILSRRPGHDMESPTPVGFDSDRATPMRSALLGYSGSAIGRDYDGKRVLAAYEPVAILNLGLVAKVDMAEIRAPFIDAALRGGLVALFSILISVILFLRATRPLEKEIAESEAYNHSIVDAAADAIVTTGKGCRISSFNPAAERIFGYTEDEAVGMRLDALIPELNGCCALDVSNRTILGSHADGTRIPLELSTSHLQTGRGQGQLHIIRDVSERARLEVELRHAQKMRAIGTLASGIAHDFNNLLMGVTGSADMALRRCDDSDPARIYLEDIKSSAIGGAAITRQLLTFGRRGGGEPTVLDLNDVVGAAEGILSRTLGADIDVHVVLSPQPLRFRAANGELEQILLNLAVNARHAMPHGGTLTIRTEAVNSDGEDHAVLTVSDTGVGMSDEVRARIFEPFFTTKASGKGTGLGLSSAYAIVEKRGGRMEVDSAPGRGTSFRVLWPRVDDVPQLEDVTTASAPAGDELVLVVEDEALVRTTIDHYLSRQGYRVVTADDATAALDLFSQRPDIDLLVTDVGLPGMSGARLADEVHAQRPDLPVLFISAYSPDELVDSRGVPAGAASLHKPFSERQLFEKVRELLDAAPPAPAPTVLPPVADAPAPPSDTTVLLIEDHQSTRLASVELLRDLGYTVLPAANASEALSLCTRHADDVDIVVTDLGLPDMDGDALFTAVRERVPNAAVLLVSGRGADDPQVLGLLAHPRTAFMMKPVDFDAMAGTITELLDTPLARAS